MGLVKAWILFSWRCFGREAPLWTLKTLNMCHFHCFPPKIQPILHFRLHSFCITLCFRTPAPIAWNILWYKYILQQIMFSISPSGLTLLCHSVNHHQNHPITIFDSCESLDVVKMSLRMYQKCYVLTFLHICVFILVSVFGFVCGVWSVDTVDSGHISFQLS